MLKEKKKHKQTNKKQQHIIKSTKLLIELGAQLSYTFVFIEFKPFVPLAHAMPTLFSNLLD